jgi:hypothetical protein
VYSMDICEADETRVAETISGADIVSVQTGHMIASDPTTHPTFLASERPSTYANWVLAVLRHKK